MSSLPAELATDAIPLTPLAVVRRNEEQAHEPRASERDDEDLASVLVPKLLRIGLSLHGTADAADQLTAFQLHDVLEELDDVIRALRLSAMAHHDRTVDGPSIRSAFRDLEAAIVGAEEAVRREWMNAAGAAPSSADPDQALRLVRCSKLITAAGRALEPNVLG